MKFKAIKNGPQTLEGKVKSAFIGLLLILWFGLYLGPLSYIVMQYREIHQMHLLGKAMAMHFVFLNFQRNYNFKDINIENGAITGGGFDLSNNQKFQKDAIRVLRNHNSDKQHLFYFRSNGVISIPIGNKKLQSKWATDELGTLKSEGVNGTYYSKWNSDAYVYNFNEHSLIFIATKDYMYKKILMAVFFLGLLSSFGTWLAYKVGGKKIQSIFGPLNDFIQKNKYGLKKIRPTSFSKDQSIELKELSEIFNQLIDKASSLKNKEDNHHISKLSLRSGQKQILIEVDGIIAFRSESKQTRVFLKEITYDSDYTLQYLEEKLVNTVFVRVHRNAIINLTKIKEIKSNKSLVLILENDLEVKVAKDRAASIRKMLKNMSQLI